MPTPRFSIATPTRNALSKLKRCVGSVRGQVDASFEHIIQDALSGDGTPEWLEQQQDLVSRSEADAGMYDAINRAWSRAGGEFLSWLNSDEQYLPGTLSHVAGVFDTHPEVDVLFGDYIVCDDEGRPIALRREIPFRRLYVANSFLYAYSCTLFYRRRLFDQGLLKLDDSFRYASDKDMLLRLEANGVRIKHVRQYFALFGVDGNNLSTHAQVTVEAEQIRRKYGAFGCQAARQGVVALRRAERLLRGAYARHNCDYQFACDEIPNYREIRAQSIGGRYSLAANCV